MDAIPQEKALAPLKPHETARFFVAPKFGALECLDATFRTHTYAPHRHETYVIGAIQTGCETWSARGQRHYAGPGELAFVNPDVVHDGEAHGGGYSYRTIYPSIELIRAIAADVSGRASVGTPQFGAMVVPDPEGALLFEAAHQALQAGADPFAAEERLTRVLARFLVRHAKLPARAIGREHGPVARARVRIETGYDDDLSLDDLASEAGQSRHHLIRAFRAETGQTPHAFLINVRVVAAKDRLRRGEPPSEVAQAVGFADQSHLTRAFKARLGVTPGAYRAAFLS